MKRHFGTCKNCGTEYSRPRPLRSEFCSKKCSKQARRIFDIRYCLFCGTQFEVISYYKKKYCSLICAGKAKSEIKKSICLVCNKEYIRCGGNIYQKYCSYTCMGLSMRKSPKKQICPICKIEYFITNHTGKKLTCGRICGGKYRFLLKMGKDYISIRDYKQERLMIDPSCELCGWNRLSGVLEVHHKDRNRKNNIRSNLILICPNCHSMDHFLLKDGQFTNNLGRTRPKIKNEMLNMLIKTDSNFMELIQDYAA
jgi:hypothetical protein